MSVDQAIKDAAHRHGLSEAAIGALAEAMRSSRGRQAQFSHPELGGMGQWSGGGMVQIGDMFNSGLKAKVAAACADLAAAFAGSDAADGPASLSGSHQAQWQGTGAAARREPAPSRDWWPAELGQANATGGQNDSRYAYFADQRRLAVERHQTVTVYDTGEHRISGSAQQQGGSSDMAFSSQLGPVRLGELTIVSTHGADR